jgi:glycosyltransferase involved in cell wall biosynthesis
MRILVVSHPPLHAELGAAQMAVNLATALQRRGHDAVAWSPEPLPARTRWWNLWKAQRDAIRLHAAATGPYDVIDTPAVSATTALARHGSIVVRSVQPELLYLRSTVAADLRCGVSPRALAHALLAPTRARAICRGWETAKLILCLGGHERAWMLARFPSWQSKLGCYVSALPAADRRQLLELRERRPRAGRNGSGARFLWLGRWTGHKGTTRLLEILNARLARFPADSATIAGCGPLAHRDIPAQWLTTGRVRVVESYRRSELAALLAEHDIGLFTSEVEGWGLTLAEMLESGMPVYATDAGAVPDLRPFFTASLRPLPVPDELPPAAPEDLGRNGYLARFDWDAIAADYERQVRAVC